MVWNDPHYQTVSGILSSEKKIEELLNELAKRDIGIELVDVLMSDQTRERYAHLVKENKMPEGASVGGLSFGILGGIIGGLTMAGTLLIPGVNLLVAGPIIGILAGGAAGVVTGGLVGALVGAGIPEYEAKEYQKELEREGNVLVIAHVSAEQVAEARDLFEKYGAKNTIVQQETAAQHAGSIR